MKAMVAEFSIFFYFTWCSSSIFRNSDGHQNAEDVFKSILDGGSDEDNVDMMEADSDSDGFLQEVCCIDHCYSPQCCKRLLIKFFAASI